MQARELARAMPRGSSCATPPPLPGVRGDRGRSRARAALVGQRDGGEGDEPALDGSQRESGGRAGGGSPTTKPMPARGTGRRFGHGAGACAPHERIRWNERGKEKGRKIKCKKEIGVS